MRKLGTREGVRANADAAKAKGRPWQSVGQTLGLTVGAWLDNLLRGVSLGGGRFQLATASVLGVVVVATAAFLLVRQLGSENGAEQITSGPARSQFTPPKEGSNAKRTAEGGAYFDEVTGGASEAEARENYRALRARFPSLFDTREPVIRPAGTPSQDQKQPFVAAIGPFPTLEEAYDFCDKLKPSGTQCTISTSLGERL
jgi:hypothetical protein